ncbi:MAG: hypothetical protein R2880_08690 [Deinococcales bacterium]
MQQPIALRGSVLFNTMLAARLKGLSKAEAKQLAESCKHLGIS